MNQGPILTPIAKGYSSTDYINAEAISKKVRASTSSFGNLVRDYSAGTTTFVKRNPFKAALITLGVAIVATGFIYRSPIVGQLRNWTKKF